MKNLKKLSSILILFAVVLALSLTNSVHAVGVIGTITVGDNPAGLAYDTGKSEIFVANYNDGTISIISDTSNNVVGQLATGPSQNALSTPDDVAYDSVKGEIFVTNTNLNNVSVISDSTNTIVANITVGEQPVGIAYDSGKGEMFVVNAASGTVSVISDSTNTVIANMTVVANTSLVQAHAEYPVSIAYDSGMNELFVTTDPGTVYVISDSSNTVVANVTVGDSPAGLAYDASKGEVFVTNFDSQTVSVISDKSNEVVATVPVGGYPESVAFDSGKSEMFVVSSGSNTLAPQDTLGSVSVISDSSNTVIANFTVGGCNGVAYDSAKGEVFTTNAGFGTVSVITDASDTSASPSPTISTIPSPTVPELSNQALILVVVLIVALTFCALYRHIKNRPDLH